MLANLRYFAGGVFQEFVNQGLVGFGLLGGHAAQLAEQPGRNADGNQLLRVASHGPADAARTAQFLRRSLGYIGEVELTIRNRQSALCALLGAR